MFYICFSALSRFLVSSYIFPPYFLLLIFAQSFPVLFCIFITFLMLMSLYICSFLLSIRISLNIIWDICLNLIIFLFLVAQQRTTCQSIFWHVVLSILYLFHYLSIFRHDWCKLPLHRHTDPFSPANIPSTHLCFEILLPERAPSVHTSNKIKARSLSPPVFLYGTQKNFYLILGRMQINTNQRKLIACYFHRSLFPRLLNPFLLILQRICILDTDLLL